MTMGKVFKRIVAGVALLAATLTGSGQATARAPRGPALWKIADRDTTIYLFGTIHTLPENTLWKVPPVAKAIAQSDSLVLELLMDHPEQAAQLVRQLGLAPNLPPLAQRIAPAKRATLARLMAASNLPPPFLDQLESWAAAIVFTDVTFLQAGFSPDNGLENQLTAIYKAANKPIVGLETAEQQLGYLDRLPDDAQRQLLDSTVEDPEAAKTELRRMLGAWLNGDVKAIGTTFDKETSASPPLRKALLINRNQNWAQWIAARMARPGTVFIAVGAGHLAGPDSLQHMLKARGIKARRVN
jgi:uncharacterized protein YbaP (TraB family)